MSPVYPVNLLLPWSASLQDDRRFRKIAITSLLVVLAIGLLVPFLSVPEIKREKLEELPPQLAKILIEKKKQPPAPKPKPKPKPEKKPEKQKAKPEPKPVEVVKKARKKAAASGLMALQDDLAEMRQTMDVSALSKRSLSKGAARAAQTDRSLLAGKTKATSGGINTGDLSKNTAGRDLASRETTRVAAPVEQAIAAESADKGAKSRSADSQPRRSEESIRATLDQNKGAIYAIYNRELRKDPALEGKVTVSVVINPDGSVLSCKVISSELASQKLERKLVARIRLIDFGAQDVLETAFNYTFDFLPY